MIPKIDLILEYKHFFYDDPPSARLDLIRNIPKIELIYEIAGLNYRLKKNNSLFIDTSINTQFRELNYFCSTDSNLFEFYAKKLFSYTQDGSYNPLIFTRAGNLISLEEILGFNEFLETENFNMDTRKVCDSLLRYLLAVNAEITEIHDLSVEGTTIENISANSLVLNELMIEDNPLNEIYKGISLLKFLLKDEIYGSELKNYFQEKVKLEQEEFIYRIITILINNTQEYSNYEFEYSINAEDHFLDFLSYRDDTYCQLSRLITIKKSPFYKVNELKYVLLDNIFLVNKCYSSFINDFWFDFLKPQKDCYDNSKFNYKHYRGVIGQFFEDYISEIIKHSYDHKENIKAFCFSELIIKTPSSKDEVADIYIRENEKILIGQVKSGSIYDNEKYSGEINTLYRKDRNQFFIDFGVDQTIKSIDTVLQKYKLFDPSLVQHSELEFFPVVVVNEKLFQTPLLANLLNIRFQELLNKCNFGIHKINPLVVIHVSDLEYIENALAAEKTTMWALLKTVYSKIDSTLIPPFYSAVADFINTDSIRERVLQSIEQIRVKYSTI